MSSYLHLSGVNKMFGEFTALRNVDLDVQKGEFLTFLGPSGSGKTTTLMIIAGFEKATRGVIKIEGTSLSGLAPHERNIGIVFQNYALFPHRTALENVYFPLQMRGIKRAEGMRMANEMLCLVGLDGFGQRYPKELSGGQQQRVALARALVFKPSLLLLDEPLGALDKSLREQMQIEIKRIQKTLGVTTIFVTHDQTEAMSMSDRIVVFDKGEIEQVAEPLELYHRPASRFVAGFVGESNLIAATIKDAANGIAETDELGICHFSGTDRFHDGQRVTLMVRPEHMMVSRTHREDHTSTRMVVRTVVNYGDHALVIGQSGKQAMRVRVPGSDVADISEGRECHVHWLAKSVHVIPS